METIVVYFSPLASTKILGKIGLGIAYHMAIVYTNASGASFGVSSGPSNQTTPQTPGFALLAVADMAQGRPSAFGVLVSSPKNNHSFLLGHPEDFYTQGFAGDHFPGVTAATALDLSAQWRIIVRSYTRIGALRLTYSPISQNSNSLAGSALRRAGIPMPFSSKTVFAPGEFTLLSSPETEDGLR